MEKNKDAQIYILTHRKSLIEENSLYTPLQIGAEYTKEDIYELKDNISKDNISSLNPIYCDVCGLYYIYKNLLKEKYIGVCGTRRYLDIKENEDFDKIFSKYDIIVNKMQFGGLKCVYQYCYCHNPQDCLIITDIIQHDYPEYYHTWVNFNFLYGLNCFMTTKEIFDDYCKFLFDILNKFFTIVNIHDIESAKKHVYNEYKTNKYDYALKHNNFKNVDDFLKYQMNIGGFLNERLFTIYVIKNNLKILERPVKYTENYDMFVNNEEN